MKVARFRPFASLCVSLSLLFAGFAATAGEQGVFRVTTIPEEAATEQIRKFAPLVKYLEQRLGQKVEFIAGERLPGGSRSARQQAGRAGVVRRLHACAGADSLGRQGGADRAARGGHAVPLRLHHADQIGDQVARRSQGQERELRLAVEHVRPSHAAQLPAAGQGRSRSRLQARGAIPARTTRRSRRS